jgi:hypothetical protein
MILYVNGDSHSAGAEAVNTYCFAEDDPLYGGLGRRPHPDNERVSYGCELANMMNAIFVCDAESASSNERIIRTTRTYLENNTPDIIVIGWTSWEREEWLYEGTYWQVNAAPPGTDWPNAIQQRHRDWVMSVDYNQKRLEWHERIWEFHKELSDIPHLFFNCFSSFIKTPYVEWGNSYIHPYSDENTYRNWLMAQGFKTVSKNSYHFGADAHRAWANLLYQNIAVD